MYKIIGADGKEYGPITADQLRQWITQGRVNAHTRARAADSQDWKALYQFPEFADAPGAPTAAAPPISAPPLGAMGSGLPREAIANSVRGPAIALIVTSILNVLLGVFQLSYMGAIERFYAGMPEFKEPRMQQSLHLMFGPVSTAVLSLGIIMSLLILFGAIRMVSLKNYAFAFTVGILAMIPCVTPCCLIGLPFGIWALAVLSRAEVKAQFG